ncbi:zinc finger protein 791-like isoform X2 [Ornithodoros turicata]|uniref:zinc finger protein 791-like isoform X2 n=1 Tax=Ornithodoros turicata TaxID=34597 RepID=UPI003139498A
MFESGTRVPGRLKRGLPGLGNQCIVCGATFRLWPKLRKHMTTHDPVPHDSRLLDECHLPDGTIQCLVCGKFAANMNSLRRHWATHTNARVFTCPKCPRTYKKSVDFLEHFKRAHTALARSYSCDQCSYTTVYRNALRAHKLRHAGMTGIVPRERCQVCFKVFYRSTLVTHYYRHTGERPHKCKRCGSGFASALRLRNHVRYVHQRAERATDDAELKPRRAQVRTGLPGLDSQCVVCGKTFSWWRKLRAHMSTHDPVPQDFKLLHKRRAADGTFQCPVCGKHLKSLSYLRQHYSYHTNDCIFSCPKCPRTYKTSTMFLVHFKRAHTTLARTYECNQCNFKTRGGTYFRTHQLKHAGINQSERCEVCFKVFKTGTLFHYYRHTGEKPHVCKQCDMGFIKVSYLKRHVKTVHGGARRAPLHAGLRRRRPAQQTVESSDAVHGTSDAGDEAYSGLPGLENKCVVCGDVFESWAPLRRHMTSHDPTPSDPAFFDKCHMVDGSIRCLICGIEHESMSQMRFHYACHTEARVFACPKCPRAFKTTSYFLIHFKMVHSTPIVHKCDQCEYTTVYSNSLRTHKLTHAGNTGRERCEVCFKFLRKRSLLPHYYQHTDERPYKCQQCKSSFVHTSHLDNHVRYVHEKPKKSTALVRTEAYPDSGPPGLNNRCVVCGDTFSLWRKLRAHMTTHDPLLHDARLLKDCRLPDGTIQCLVCGKLEGTMSTLRTHFVSHTDARVFTCPRCSRTYKSSANFLAHFKRAHTALARTYDCDRCDYRSFYSVGLRRHKLKHEGKAERERCEVCFKVVLKDRLLYHYYLHTGEKPHACKQCDRGFPCASLLKIHVQYVHERAAVASGSERVGLKSRSAQARTGPVEDSASPGSDDQDLALG